MAAADSAGETIDLRPAGAGRRLVSGIDKAGVAVAPGLFGYQLVFELEPAAS